MGEEFSFPCLKLPWRIYGGRETCEGCRIYGGRETCEGCIPWQVSLHAMKDWSPYAFCGGSIIDARFILTAAHCVTHEIIGKVNSNCF